jgi:hypothetical protein
MPQSLFEAGKDRWLVTGVNVDDAVGLGPQASRNTMNPALSLMSVG